MAIEISGGITRNDVTPASTKRRITSATAAWVSNSIRVVASTLQLGTHPARCRVRRARRATRPRTRPFRSGRAAPTTPPGLGGQQRPRSMNVTRSQTASASAMSWVVMKTVRPSAQVQALAHPAGVGERHLTVRRLEDRAENEQALRVVTLDGKLSPGRTPSGRRQDRGGDRTPRVHRTGNTPPVEGALPDQRS